MPINDLKIPLATAGVDLVKEATTKNRTYRGTLYTDQGARPGYLKLVHPGELAREALFAVLGKYLALPIPQPYYVSVPPSLVGGEAGGLFQLAFASEAELIPAQRILQDDPFLNIGNRSEIYKCAAFDAWIANRDRIPKNILYSGHKGYWLIDHEEAMPNHLTETEAIGAQLVSRIAQGKSEFDLFKERESMLRFCKGFELINWSEIRESLRPDQSEIAEHIIPITEKLIDLLIKRIPHMREILSKDLGIKQKDMFTESNSSQPEEKGRAS